MFTGLVQAIGAVASIDPGPAGGLRLVVDPGAWPHRPLVGESIAVSGCCLTVAEDPAGTQGRLAFDAVPETLAKTTLGALRPGSRVNLERSLRADDLMGGHTVQGHVEGVGEVLAVQPRPDYRLRIRPPADLMPCIIPKGSIAIDGVSLTIAAADPHEGTFEVALIPTTLELTTLGDLRPGARVNLETDIQARTLLHLLRNYLPTLTGAGLYGSPSTTTTSCATTPIRLTRSPSS
jgi:riboflavin synthase